MALNFNTNLSVIAAHYIEALQVKVLSSSLQKKIIENPYYPSLYSLTDTFRKYNIDTEAYEIPVANIVKLEPPFIAYIRSQNGNDFALVKGIKENMVSYLADNNKEVMISLERFSHHYQGYVLLAETNTQSGDPNYTQDVRREKHEKLLRNYWVAALTVLLLIVVTANVYQHSAVDVLSYTAVGVLKLLGLAVSCLLLAFDIDKDNILIKSICTAGKKINCNAILESKTSKVFGISWSEIGFFYFSAGLFFLLIPTIDFKTKFTWLAIVNGMAAPYVLFSIYYQWKVVKQWCTLCLFVQGVLTAELLWSIAVYWSSPVMPFVNLPVALVAVFSVTFPVLIWYGIKPLLKRAKDHTLYKAAYKRIQYNKEVFNSLLRQQAPAPEGYEMLGIGIGNPEAKNTIIKICNPYCGPCAKAHPELETLIKANPDVNVRILFTVSNDTNDNAGIVAKHMLAIAQTGDQRKTQKALDDWYLAKEKDYKTFAAKYPLNGEIEKQSVRITAMSEWCDKAAVAYTPTFFVNGYRLPEGYGLEELKDIF